MTEKLNNSNEMTLPDSSPRVLGLTMVAAVMGVLVAVAYLPAWQPGLAASILGDSPKAYWFLSRGSALAAYGLLWLSMALGLALTNKLARAWPGGPTAFDVHQYVSILGMGFALFHGLILLGDRFMNFHLAQILVPFSTQGYKPLWVGLGQLAFYLWALITLSFYVRKQMGNKTWRWVHSVSFLTFGLAILHGIASGTDTSTGWASAMYWVSGGILLFLLVYRIAVTVAAKPRGRQLVN